MKRLSTVALALSALVACGNENDLVTDPDPNDFGDNLAPIAIPGPYVRGHVGVPAVLDAEQSVDPDGTVELYSWTVLAGPSDGTGVLTDADTVAPAFTADALGIYEVSLVVTDDGGRPSNNPATTIVDVVPWTELTVELNWEGATDYDVHLLAPGGTYFGEGDCWFGMPGPDWGTAGFAPDDPTFDDDIEDGDGAETIFVPAPAAGAYEIYVHHYNPRGVETNYPMPKIVAQFEGTTVANETGPRLFPGDVWKVGTVDVASGAFVLDDTVTTHEDLGGPPYNY